MNTHYRKHHSLITLSFALLLSLIISLTSAIPSAHAFGPRKPEPPLLPPVISLLESTPLYPEPDESLEPWATLTPQDVQTVEAESDWYLYGGENHQEKKWIKIKTTWLGDLWIHLEYDRIGTIKPIDSYIALIWPAALYTQPVQSTLTDIILEPQTVHANAIFESPVAYLSYPYRIETSWLGDQWLVSPNRILLDMEIINADMDLPTETLYMDEYDTANRMQRPSDARFIPAQKVFAMEKTNNGVYHVRAENGTTFWINPAYAQPVGAKSIDQTIELHTDTMQYLFPTMPFPSFGAISPQKVKAFEQWDDPQNHRWYRIHSWSGDLWIMN